MIIAKSLVAFVFALFVVTGAVSAGYYAMHGGTKVAQTAAVYKTQAESDLYVRFLMEGYDIIADNLWIKLSDDDMGALYQASVQKFASSTALLPQKDRASVAAYVAMILAEKPEAERKMLAETMLGAILYNLQPIGRNQLLTSNAASDLHNEVNNINPSKDLYKDVGVDAGASTEAVQKAFEEKKAALEASSTPEAKKELAAATYAKHVLTDTDAKANYDTAKVEPTVFAHLVNPSTLYVYIQQMSPATEAEFESVLKNKVTANVSSMILDVRGNIGGDLVTSQTFLGLFSGPNQYAFDFYVRGAYEAQRTLGLGSLAQAKQLREIAVFTDGMTQSTAEVVTAAMKRLRIGKVVGVTTRGWGSVEQVFPMQTILDVGGAHSIMLVVRLTVRDDGQPIESKGVSPDVDTTVTGWEKELPNVFFSSDLISAIKKQYKLSPDRSE